MDNSAGNIEIRSRPAEGGPGMDFFFWLRGPFDGREAIFPPKGAMEFSEEPVREGQGVQSLITLPPAQVQRLFDDLWQHGFRPTEAQAPSSPAHQTQETVPAAVITAKSAHIKFAEDTVRGLIACLQRSHRPS